MLAATEPVIGGLAKDSDMGSKPILEPTPDVPEPAIVIDVQRGIIELPIQLWKGRVYGLSSRACEKTTAAANYVWRQMNIGPEVIQRESQDDVSRYNTRPTTE